MLTNFSEQTRAFREFYTPVQQLLEDIPTVQYTWWEEAHASRGNSPPKISCLRILFPTWGVQAHIYGPGATVIINLRLICPCTPAGEDKSFISYTANLLGKASCSTCGRLFLPVQKPLPVGTLVALGASSLRVQQNFSTATIKDLAAAADWLDTVAVVMEDALAAALKHNSQYDWLELLLTLLQQAKAAGLLA